MVSRRRNGVRNHFILAVGEKKRRPCESKMAMYTGPCREAQNGNPCAGINRHEAEDAKFLRERASDPLGPEFCAGHREVVSEA